MSRERYYHVTDVVISLTVSPTVMEQLESRAEQAGLIGAGAIDGYVSDAVQAYLAVLNELGENGHIYVGHRDEEGNPVLEKELVIR